MEKKIENNKIETKDEQAQCGERRLVDVASIRLGPHSRKDADTADLQASINTNGLIHDPVVKELQDGGTTAYEVIAGARRLQAITALGWKQVNVIVRTFKDELAAELMSIDENLKRKNYDETETEEKLKRRQEIYHELHKESRPGVAGAIASNKKQGKGDTGAENSSVSFVEDTAQKTGESKRVIQKKLKRAKEQSDAVKQARKEKKITASQTDALIELPKEEQDKVLPKVIKKSIEETKAVVAAKKTKQTKDAEHENPLLTKKAVLRLQRNIEKLSNELKLYVELASDLRFVDPDDIIGAIGTLMKHLDAIQNPSPNVQRKTPEATPPTGSVNGAVPDSDEKHPVTKPLF